MVKSCTISRFSSVATCVEPGAPTNETIFPARDYDLAATLACGQAFRWQQRDGLWIGVVRGRWVELRQTNDGIRARAAVPQSDWCWLADYLQTGVDLDAIVASFPDNEPMRNAVVRCRGMRLLRQEPWECLASFILSSTKQIIQIRQIVAELCAHYGEPVAVPRGEAPAFAFPTAGRIAALTEADLRACKMGFRAPYLLKSARLVAEGGFDLEKISSLELAVARARLLALPGVGNKIADCVLLFACGFAAAFPLDVWVMKSLRQFYFRGRAVHARKLRAFADTQFGPNGGYAQQYLFHSLRLSELKKLSL